MRPCVTRRSAMFGTYGLGDDTCCPCNEEEPEVDCEVFAAGGDGCAEPYAGTIVELVERVQDHPELGRVACPCNG